MSVFFSTVKCFVFAFNLVCLILGIGEVSVGALGLQNAKPATDEHTYFIVVIILGSMICMTTFFGCYGVVCELLGVNIIYAFFMLLLLVVQYLQMQAYQPHAFYRNAVERLEDAWMAVKTQPQPMQALETNYQCCALHSPRDYSHLGLATPFSCYQLEVTTTTTTPTSLNARGCFEALQTSYQCAARREKFFSWALIVSECIVCIYSIMMSVALYRQNRMRRFRLQPVRGFVEPLMPAGFEPQTNHIGSRANLLSH